MSSNLRTIKELCDDLRKSRTWVHGVKKAMEEAGITWPGNMMEPSIVLMFVARTKYRCTGYAKPKATRDG